MSGKWRRFYVPDPRAGADLVLEHLNPALYEVKCQGTVARFDEAVRLAELQGGR